MPISNILLEPQKISMIQPLSMIKEYHNHSSYTHSFERFPEDSTALEKKDRHLAQIKVDKVFGFVGDVAAKVPANDAMPGWVVFLVEFFLYVCSNILLNVELINSLRGAVNGVLLHVLQHIGILDYGFAVSHPG